MKIKIKKSGGIHSWYRDKIGKIYEVLEDNSAKKHYIVHKGRIIDSFVNYDDCEVLNEAIVSEDKFCDCNNSFAIYIDQYKVKRCYNCLGLIKQN